MPYVQRDSSGHIVGVFSEHRGDAQEWQEADSAEVRSFVSALKDGGLPAALDRLEGSDHALIRVVEDLVDTLICHKLIRFTDLPEAAQSKLIERRTLRRSVNALNLFRVDEQKLI